MFRIRKVTDTVLPANRDAVADVVRILETQFPEAPRRDAVRLREGIENPMRFGFRAMLFVSENGRGQVTGFASVLHDPVLRFCWLDYLSAASARTGGGIGGALYERVREEAALLSCIGVFCECLPDDPALCPEEGLAQNISRLKFYERFGARPVIGTKYETPVNPDDSCAPYLVFDPLGGDTLLPVDHARLIVRAVLERRYAGVCPPAYVDMVVSSFTENPVRIRPAKYVKKGVDRVPKAPADILAALVVNEGHAIHHVHDRGYVEAPVRIDSILGELDASNLFMRIKAKTYPEKWITDVHEKGYVSYFKKVCALIEPGRSVYPYVFPVRNVARPPKDLPVRAGYYCIDTFTPLNRNAWLAAVGAVNAALTAADEVLSGRRISYALVRPPGHHAEWRNFGGFCYFNNAAVAAEKLSRHGTVAMLDIDYHHGNGQEDIFYRRKDVFTVSIHGHPSFAYPYFSGFAEDAGADEGRGYNLNIPLPEEVDGARYRKALEKALAAIRKFKPDFLVVCLGLDPAKGDPTGTWSLMAKDFEANGRLIGGLDLPTVVVQEGGYKTRTLGANARSFFTGLCDAAGARRG